MKTGREEAPQKVAEIEWEPRLAKRVAGMKSSVIRELLKLTEQPDIISFAGGLPAPEFFPIREFEEGAMHVLRSAGPRALQYSTTEGFPPLRQWLAEAMAKYHIEVTPDNILMTNGSQQALDLIGKLFVEPGSCVLTSAPTYLGALQAWNSYEACYETVDQDDDGILIDRLRETLKRVSKPRMFYVLPNFQNPGGSTMPLDRREELVRIAREYDLILIEDDPYGELRYEGEDVTPIYRLAPERTIYLSTFSKTLAPGIRLGWIVAPQPIIRRFVQAKQGADLNTGILVQMLANDICQRGILKSHVKKLRGVYRERRDTMLAALEEYWPSGCSWTRPAGGLFLWAKVPEKIDTKDLLVQAVEKKVAFVPGMAFYPGESGGHNAMRLNFSNATVEQIREGIRRLGEAIRVSLR
ncbi:MAG: PLP-dependent aminotransferase family protein [Candidatus Eisenbacteria bacterium]|nr:PLP-dependent aminotransferase family protein [Candidatus Eisenbacteria bacterium]